MVASKTPAKKTPAKKSVTIKRSLPKKITLKKDLDEEFPHKKITLKKSFKTKSVIKAPPKIAEKKSTESSPKITKNVKRPVAINSSKQDTPDEQITVMIDQISQSISAIAEQSDKREERSLEMLKALTDSLQNIQTGTAANNNPNEIARRNRLIGISAAAIGTVAILAILYVVNILGTAMTDISGDIHKIQLSVGDISTRIDSMTLDINSMSGNMHQLNRNVTTISKDLSILSYTLAPSLQGMRGYQPWAPSP